LFGFSQIFWEACGPVALLDELPVPSANPSDVAVSSTEHHAALTHIKKKVFTVQIRNYDLHLH
jgi:hypothetical protein